MRRERKKFCLHFQNGMCILNMSILEADFRFSIIGGTRMYYTIGEVSKMFDLPVSTLRYYDREGLFPDIQRQSGGRRFSEKEIETLKLIECLKISGLEIKDIRQFIAWTAMGKESYPQRRALFEMRKEAVEAEISRLQRTLDMLKFKCWYYETAMKDGSEETIHAMLPDKLPPEIQALYDRSHGRE